jgi:hypothetical protein
MEASASSTGLPVSSWKRPKSRAISATPANSGSTLRGKRPRFQRLVNPEPPGYLKCTGRRTSFPSSSVRPGTATGIFAAHGEAAPGSAVYAVRLAGDRPCAGRETGACRARPEIRQKGKTPVPGLIVLMSLQPAIPWRVALQQNSPPFYANTYANRSGDETVMPEQAPWIHKINDIAHEPASTAEIQPMIGTARLQAVLNLQ